MIRRPAPFLLIALLVLKGPAAAQTSLTLPDAIARARTQNPAAATAASEEREAVHRAAQARAGYLPRVDASESWQRGNQPVFVFSSLLGQRRFTAADFALAALNQPDPVNNFRSTVTVEQALYDAERGAGVLTAGIVQQMAGVNRRLVDHDLAASVASAYGRVLLAIAARQSTAAAADTAGADRMLAANRRDAGLVTDADVLQFDVFLARAREQQIRAAADERIARAELNQLMGEPLESAFTFDRAGMVPAIETVDLRALEAEALRNRPDVELAALHERLAAASESAARAAFLPKVMTRGGWEFNGGTWNARASSWVAGVEARISVFQGFADKARLAVAREQRTRRSLERMQAETAARLGVTIAAARLEAAHAGESVSRAAAAQAGESQRIIRDRYEAGLTDVSTLLRATEAVVQAETQQTAAAVAVMTETAALERALGRR